MKCTRCQTMLSPDEIGYATGRCFSCCVAAAMSTATRRDQDEIAAGETEQSTIDRWRNHASTLRPYQQRAIADLRRAYQRGKRAPLLVSPTGSGKTVIAAEIIRSARSKSNRTLFVAPRRELLKQTVAKLAIAGITDVRVIQSASDTGRPDAPVVIGSIQTLTLPRWLGKLPPADLVIADEAHHMAADLWSQLATHYPDARWLGLSATPERADGRALGDIFDCIVVGATIAELTSAGHLVPSVTWSPPRELEPGELAMTIPEALRRWPGHTVVFCTSLAQAHSIGLPVISGSTPARTRDATLAAFASGDIPAVANCMVLTEGWDAPIADTCILARRFGHPGLFLQCVGRVLRTHPGKTKATIVDLCGSVHRHGLPDSERVYSLEGRAISVNRQPIKQCQHCGTVFAHAWPCPGCGFAPDVEVIPVEPIDSSRITGDEMGIVSAARPKPEHVVPIKAKYSFRCRLCLRWGNPGESIYWATVSKQATHAVCEADRLLRGAV